LVLKKFDQSKDERDLELEKIKVDTQAKIDSLKEDNQLKVLLSDNEKLLSSDFKKLTKKLMRSQIINDGKRVDGRELDEVRKISATAGILPKRVHGSALFQRGLTQVLSTTTLGTPSDAQEMDDLNPSTEKTYLHHYNFPPYSVGETRPMRTPGRREIGHGALAERAITNSFNSVRFFKTSLISFNAGRSNSSYKQGINILVVLFFRLLFNSLSRSLVTPYSCIVVINPC